MNAIKLFTISFLLFVFILILDLTFWDATEKHESIRSIVNSLIAEEPPKFTPLHFVKTGLIFLCSFLFVSAILKISSNNAGKEEIKTSASTFSFSSIRKTNFLMHYRKIILWFIAFLSFYFLCLFIWDPEKFSQISLEDELIENLSAILYFLAGGIFLYILFNFNVLNANKNYGVFLVALGFAGVFFLIGMEEISWFQRILDIKTPKILKANDQDELNLHNLITDPVENAYYFSAFVFFILIPFFNEKTSLFKKIDLLSIYIPNRFLLFCGAIIMAYNYDMWNILLTQFSFFVTLIILIYYCRSALRMNENFVYLFTLLLIYVFSQFIFLVFGSNFVREWDLTEYKEFYIALAFFLYSIEVLKRSIQLKVHSNDSGLTKNVKP